MEQTFDISERGKMGERAYVCIDLKSFYASVECADRGLDPFSTNLVVADPERSNTTICLAITPAMKALGVKNRCRIFEIPESIEYFMATPRMRRYMEVSAQIYSIYLRYVSPEDVHVYSIDECFIDATPYLSLYGVSAKTFATMLMDAVMSETRICATAGLGPNLFLSKVALDITAKHTPDNIGTLDEESFKREIWFHRPITDIWGIGPGIARRLARHGAYDLAGIAALSQEVLYREFGVNAEFLIDHAWGQEPCTIADIHAYRPEGHSLHNGQILPCDYTFEEARDVLIEMVDASVLELTEKRLVAGSIALSVGYAHAPGAFADAETFEGGHGLRRLVGREAEGRTGASRKLEKRSNSARYLRSCFCALYDKTTSRTSSIRRVQITFGALASEENATMTLFDDVEAQERERRLQETLVAVRGKYGKNAMLKGTSLKEKATAKERNMQVGGHRA